MAKSKSQNKSKTSSANKSTKKKKKKPEQVTILYRGPNDQADIDGEIVKRDDPVTVSYKRYQQLRRQPGFNIDKIKES